jgi:hypothetical protein
MDRMCRQLGKITVKQTQPVHPSIAARLEVYPNLNFMALVRERTIPTERPQLVDEDSAEFYG